jgi:hypothetical protein
MCHSAPYKNVEFKAILTVNWLIWNRGFSLFFFYFTVFNFVVNLFAHNDMQCFDCEKAVFKKQQALGG